MYVPRRHELIRTSPRRPLPTMTRLARPPTDLASPFLASRPAFPCSKKFRDAALGSKRFAERGEQSCSRWSISLRLLNGLFSRSLIQPECNIAQAYCGEKLQDPFIEGEINPYDISKPCTTLGEDLCASGLAQCLEESNNLLVSLSSTPRRPSSRPTSTSLG